MSQIRVVISRKGQVTMTGEGFTGDACVSAMAPLLERLKVQPGTEQQEFLPEHFQVEAEQTQQAGQGE